VKAHIRLTNTGRTAITGWQLTWAFTGAQSVRQANGAVVSQQGATVIARNPKGASTLRPREKHTIELIIRPGRLAAPAPELFRLNGSACRSV
jgi:endoglucanase